MCMWMDQSIRSACKYDSHPHIGIKVELEGCPHLSIWEAGFQTQKPHQQISELRLKVEANKIASSQGILWWLLKTSVLCNPGLWPLHPSSQEQRAPVVLSRWSACHLCLAKAPALGTVEVKKEPPQKSTTNLHLSIDHYSLFSSATTRIWTMNTHTLMQARKQLLVIKWKEGQGGRRKNWNQDNIEQ